jgi:hypothetical protein
LDLILIDGATLLVRARAPPETWTTRLQPCDQPEPSLVDHLSSRVIIFSNDCSKFEQSAKWLGFRHHGLHLGLRKSGYRVNRQGLREARWYTTKMPIHFCRLVLRRSSGWGAAMRRRLEIFIPIVMLAVLVQLMAPIAVFRVVAYATTDPLYLTSICSGITSDSDAQTDPASKPHHHGDCCAFCVGSHGGAVAVDPPPLIFVSLQRQYQQIFWLEAAEPMPVFRVGSNAQARAPPPLT